MGHGLNRRVLRARPGGRAWRGHVARWRCELLNAQALGLGRAVRLDAALAGEDCAGRMPCIRDILRIMRNSRRAADAACGRVQGCALAAQAASGWPYCTSGWDTSSIGGYCGQGRKGGCGAGMLRDGGANSLMRRRSACDGRCASTLRWQGRTAPDVCHVYARRCI